MLPFWCCLRFVIDFQSVVREPLGRGGGPDKVPGGPKQKERDRVYFPSDFNP